MPRIAIVINGEATIYQSSSFGVSVNQYEGFDLVVSADNAEMLGDVITEHPKESVTAPLPPVSEGPEMIPEGVGKPSSRGYKTDEPFPDSFPVSEAKEILDILTKLRKDKFIEIKAPSKELSISLEPIVIQTKEFEIAKIQEAVSDLVRLEKENSSGKTILMVKEPACEFTPEQATFHIKEHVLFEELVKIETNE